MRLSFRNSPAALLATVAFLAAGHAASGQSDPHRGLWVGQVTLNYVNEVPVPLDENDNPVAPDPNVPTPTADQAQLRVLLHVNGAGQVSLLRDVAIVNRNPGAIPPGTLPASVATGANESDLVLVTDPRLYGQFPPQPAVRLGSAAFDFGDARATSALDEVVRRAAERAAQFVNTNTTDLSTEAGRRAATTAAAAEALTAASPVVTEADAASAFDVFLRDEFKSTDVDAIAAAANPDAEAQDELAAATLLANSSFYRDTRASNMVVAVVAAVKAASTPAAKRADAHNTASAYADIVDNYHRFIAGKIFGDMILGAASAGAGAAVKAEATPASVLQAVNGNAAVVAARREALQIKVARYLDTRSTLAVEVVLAAVVGSVNGSLPAVQGQAQAIEAAAVEAGRLALAESVVRYPVSAIHPTSAYNDFLAGTDEERRAGTDFASSPSTAATAAASGAVLERANNALHTLESLQNAAKVAALNALRRTYAAAARTLLTELPLVGALGPGLGDPRLTYDIKKSNGAPLGPPALTGEILLPANHPTNPFRHRNNPDHTSGYDLTRLLRLDFNPTPANAAATAGYGVERLSGVYREEVHGLHKPLGPNRDIGLRTEGKFELRRISLIDSLNAR